MQKYREGIVITATELKMNLGRYLDIVADKNDVVITKNNKKIARLTPYITDIEAYFTVREKALDYVYGGKKVSYEEFMEINEKSTERMEYLNGEIYLMSSPTSFHQDVLGNLHIIFSGYFGGKPCKVYLAPFDVHFFKKDIKEPDVLQPDITVACDYKTTINEKGKYMGVPALVLEILSDSTRSRDMVDKLNTYMMSGVREYWVVDRKSRSVLVYSFKDCGIADMKSYKNGETAESFYFSGLKCGLGEVFAQ